MGNLEQLMGMIPGMKAGALKDAKIDEKAMARTEAIIKSMTMKEREHPEIIQASRKIRIAKGSGTTVRSNVLRIGDYVGGRDKGLLEFAEILTSDAYKNIN